MNVLINHCWCSDSNWGGQYNCRVIVSIDMVPIGKSYYDDHEPDWLNLIDEVELDGETALRLREYDTQRLKPEVMQWLTDNIKDRIHERDGHKQGWAVGTDEYNCKSGVSFSLFFERQTDAMKFQFII